MQRIFLSFLLLSVQFLTASLSVSANDAAPEPSAGENHQSRTAEEKEKTWTIFIYGSCDSNLSSSLACDLGKIETVGSSPAFRIVGQVDFDSTQEEDNAEYGLPPALSYGVTRFLFEKSDDPDHITSKPLERLPELALDDPRVLYDFLNWGLRKFPADRYGLVFSNHGGGWGGFGWDSQDSMEDYDSRGLQIYEMAAVIRNLMNVHRISQFDFIAYDACLMAEMEVIDYFNGLCHYFIGDPEVDFGDGWNYGPALKWLKEHPNAPMEEFAKEEVQAWGELHMEDGKDGDLLQGGHSAIDMTKYPLVKTNFNLFCRELAADYSPGNLILPKMRRMASEYGGDPDKAPGEVAEFIDLGDFARGFAQSKEVSPKLQQKAKALADSIDAMVTAKILGVDKYGASGLSIWYPIFHSDEEESEDDDSYDEEAEDDTDDGDEDDYDSDDEYDYYAEDEDDDEDWEDEESLEEKIEEGFQDYYRLSLFRNSTLWPDYLKYVSEARENFNEDELMVFAESAYKTIPQGESFSTTISVDESAGAFQLHGTLVRKPLKSAKRYTEFGEVITANLNGSGEYKLHWTPNLFYLCGADAEASPLALYPKNSIGNYYTACAEYQKTPDDETIDIQILILFQDGKGRILSVLQDGGDLSPIPVALAPGGIVTPDYWKELRKGDDPDRWKGKYFPSKHSVTVPPEGIEGLTIKARPLPPGKYSLEFEVENVNAEYSDPVEVPLNIVKEEQVSAKEE